jgi:urease accessory protein
MSVDASLIRLLQLSSSALPIGGFTYSQGLEWAVECGWVHDEATLKDWLSDLIEHNLAALDIPILLRLFDACEQQNEEALQHWSQQLMAYRESSELRQEELNRGRALARLLIDLEIPLAQRWQQGLNNTQLAGFALASVHWEIPKHTMAQGYAWSWLENMVISGVKLIPLGQAAGQRILTALAEQLACEVLRGMALPDEAIGSAAPALAYASAKHETQYTRLYRS